MWCPATKAKTPKTDRMCYLTHALLVSWYWAIIPFTRHTSSTRASGAPSPALLGPLAQLHPCPSCGCAGAAGFGPSWLAELLQNKRLRVKHKGLLQLAWH